MVCNCNSDNNEAGSVSEINTPTTDCSDITQCVTPPTAAPCVASCTCGCSPCQCQSAAQITPLPYYAQSPTCQEEHTNLLIHQNFTTTVSTGGAVNMPACDAQISIVLPGVQTLQIGSYLWNAVYGYLKVISFNFGNATAIVENECQAANAAPGTSIPACTLFNIVDPPYASTDACGEGVWLTADFVVPAISMTVAIQVTSTAGLTIFSTVQVGTKAYTIHTIDSFNQITILNLSAAAPVPGTTVHAYDAEGHCITPITPYEDIPCTASPEDSGSLVICNTFGNTTVLDAHAAGQIPVCTDPTFNVVEFQTLDIPALLCTTLDACLVLVSGTTVYTILVVDSTGFAIGDFVYIGDANSGVDQIVWKVTDVPDGTHIEITDVAAQTLDYTVAEGITVCEKPCCEQIEYRLNHLCEEDWSALQKGEVDTTCEAATFGSLNSGDPDYVSSTRTVNFSNDTCDTMRVMVAIDYLAQLNFNINQDSWVRYSLKTYFGYSTANFPAAPAAPVQSLTQTLTEEKVFGPGSGAVCQAHAGYQFVQWHETQVIAIAPGKNLRLDAHLAVQYLQYRAGSDVCTPMAGLGADGTGLMSIDSTVCMHAIGIALKEA